MQMFQGRSGVTQSDIPSPANVSKEQIEAFMALLVGLFAEHPPDDDAAARCMVGQREPATYCRYCALQYRNTPKMAAYWACDTGVPNEKILAAYGLIFTLRGNDD